MSGGNIYQTLDAIRRYGSCADAPIEYVAEQTQNPYDGSLPFDTPYRRFLLGYQIYAAGLEYYHFLRNFDPGSSRFCVRHLGEVPTDNPNGASVLVDFLTRIVAAERAANQMCKGSASIRMSHLPNTQGFSNQDARNDPRGYTRSFIEEINARFDADNPQPVAINYCGTLLENRNYRKYTPSGGPGDPCTFGRHASVLIGRRMYQGRCQYLLRNSFGTDCHDSRLDSNWGSDCENGQFWIDAESIAQNADEVIWLED